MSFLWLGFSKVMVFRASSGFFYIKSKIEINIVELIGLYLKETLNNFLSLDESKVLSASSLHLSNYIIFFLKLASLLVSKNSYIVNYPTAVYLLQISCSKSDFLVYLN
ncbi:hypothetical protein D5R40_26515 [Okeania hirsuta]|uniref:Uncharacterized protein n=1 Tax=Okeania hirsuta TaxID=1458930 RepID=A0A3N6PQ91_9CYAN|nr:hypothetical protein D4Z78_31595 [Okeania hirsuta]RQH13409.1 hypothetical protein D4Z78_23980 [Okeania hirsuta]RQH27777.1 hypothetical protein D5R40_26515 [Okeania hirsuta]